MSSAIAIAPRSLKKKVGIALWMDRVLEECDRASVGLAPDPVHDLRVALRRCRSVADGIMAIDPDPAWKEMKKAGRDLFRSLGVLRDIHVMKEWTELLAMPGDPGAPAVLQHLQASEFRFQQNALAALLKFDRKQWSKWGAVLPRRAAKLRPGSNVFKHLALERWMDAHDLHHRALRNRSRVSFHNLRIGLKRFRYIVENFLPQQHVLWNTDLKKLQDLLGEVHDLDVLWTTLVRLNPFVSAQSRSLWHDRIVKERNSRIEKYRTKMVGKDSLWPAWRSQLPLGNQVPEFALERLKVWAAALDRDFKHSLHVTKLALQIYDGLTSCASSISRRAIPLSRHDKHRIILKVAALVHDVGRSRRESKPHKATYKLVEKLTPPLGFDREELHLVAVIARYHRGALPRSTNIEQQWLTTGDRKVVMILAGILRVANALDADADGRIRGVRIEQRNGVLIILAQGYSPAGRLASGVASARHLLELACKVPVIIKTMRVDRPEPRKLSGVNIRNFIKKL